MSRAAYDVAGPLNITTNYALLVGSRVGENWNDIIDGAVQEVKGNKKYVKKGKNKGNLVRARRATKARFHTHVYKRGSS